MYLSIKIDLKLLFIVNIYSNSRFGYILWFAYVRHRTVILTAFTYFLCVFIGYFLWFIAHLRRIYYLQYLHKNTRPEIEFGVVVLGRVWPCGQQSENWPWFKRKYLKRREFCLSSVSSGHWPHARVIKTMGCRKKVFVKQAVITRPFVNTLDQIYVTRTTPGTLSIHWAPSMGWTNTNCNVLFNLMWMVRNQTPCLLSRFTDIPSSHEDPYWRYSDHQKHIRNHGSAIWYGKTMTNPNTGAIQQAKSVFDVRVIQYSSKNLPIYDASVYCVLHMAIACSSVSLSVKYIICRRLYGLYCSVTRCASHFERKAEISPWPRIE